MTEDQYDTLLQAAEPGLIITVNNSTENSIGSKELTVQTSDSNETNVALESNFGDRYRIHRRGGDELMFEEADTDGIRRREVVETIEILGVK